MTRTEEVTPETLTLGQITGRASCPRNRQQVIAARLPAGRGYPAAQPSRHEARRCVE